jgi:hypothetical protein
VPKKKEKDIALNTWHLSGINRHDSNFKLIIYTSQRRCMTHQELKGIPKLLVIYDVLKGG